jgi:hypothetical protein
MMLSHFRRANLQLKTYRSKYPFKLSRAVSGSNNSGGNIAPDANSLVVGDLVEAPRMPRTPELIPRGYLNGIESIPEFVGHIRWLLQKHRLGQDVFLMGFPTSLRRQVVMAAAELFNWEIEYMAITRDTTEADLKQRREIVGDSVSYFDQAPVRAAVHGRVLVLDGIENAERNVLPCLNNLLENREMALDDGSFLSDKIAPVAVRQEAGVSPPGLSSGAAARIVPVHPDFRVIALGLPVPPFPGRTLDPPLRSRFQACYASVVLYLLLYLKTLLCGHSADLSMSWTRMDCSKLLIRTNITYRVPNHLLDFTRYFSKLLYSNLCLKEIVHTCIHGYFL